MRRADRQINDDNVMDDVISRSKICRIGLNDEGEVYIVPLNFGYVRSGNRRVFYFHGSKCGRKAGLIRANSAVSFELDTDFRLMEADVACGYSAVYACVMGTGVIEELTDGEEKVQALSRLMETMTGMNGWTFDEGRVDGVAVYRLDVEKISCKIHRIS